MGEMSVAMDAEGMEASIKIALKDILWTSRSSTLPAVEYRNDPA